VYVLSVTVYGLLLAELLKLSHERLERTYTYHTSYTLPCLKPSPLLLISPARYLHTSLKNSRRVKGGDTSWLFSGGRGRSTKHISIDDLFTYTMVQIYALCIVDLSFFFTM